MTYEYRSPLRDFMPLIGEVTIEWNQMQSAVLYVFQFIMPCPKEVSEAIFLSLRSDRAQRQLVIDAARAVPSIGSFSEQVVDAIKSVAKEAELRNATIHGWWVAGTNNVGLQYPNRLSQVGDADEMKKELLNMIARYQHITMWLADLMMNLDKNIDLRELHERQKPLLESPPHYG